MTSDAPDPGEEEHRPVVVVTGGSGLLGSKLVERLRDRYQVVSVDLDGNPDSPSDVEFICTDLTSDYSVARAIERIRSLFGDRIDSVVHLAAYYDFSGEPSPLYEAVTVEGTDRLLRHLDGRAAQFVFSSTMLVHAPGEPGEPIDESAPVQRSWAYPTSKVDTEEVVSTHADETRSVIVRLAGVYDEDGHSPPITNQIKRIHGHWPTSHFYPAELERGQAFIHLEDAVTALERIVDRRDSLPDDVDILIGEPDTVGYGELQEAIGRHLHGRDWTTWQVPPALARAGARIRELNPFGEDPFVKPWMIDHAGDHYDIDISLARELLEWSPRYRVLDVLPGMIERLRQDPEGWYRENGLRRPTLAVLLERTNGRDDTPSRPEDAAA